MKEGKADGELGLAGDARGGLRESQEPFSWGQRSWEFCKEEEDDLCLSGRRFSFMDAQTRPYDLCPFQACFLSSSLMVHLRPAAINVNIQDSIVCNVKQF